ncbi:TrwL protein [Bartonella australis AUST/NH1]|uniref:TrwL protein n=1 Tax=Bartonella australis (strain Aust/NH1) TaxID=1094489 RepID=M1N5B6_BARAA|nr:TrbC/VirB2 family protein [Bartonella australis]AGF75069.1 TrwL protein [Bartonella australis AUST/NH1]
MRQLNILRTKIVGRIAAASVAAVLFLAPHSIHAQQKLVEAKNIMAKLKGELSTIIPVIAISLLLFLVIGRVFRFISRSAFIRWAVCIITAGLAFYITNMLFEIS